MSGFTEEHWKMVCDAAESTGSTPDGVMDGLCHVVFGKSWEEKKVDDMSGSMVILSGKHKNRTFKEVEETDEAYVRWILSRGDHFSDQSLVELQQYFMKKFELVKPDGGGKAELIDKLAIGAEGARFLRGVARNMQ